MTTRSTPPVPDGTAPPPSVASLLSRAVGMLGLLTLLTGVAYPLVVTVVARTAFADQATGSILTHDGKVVGSRLVGQSFAAPK